MANDERVEFFGLLASFFSGEASAEQLYKIELLVADDDMRYEMQVLQEMWHQGPETDQAALQSVWERVVGKILFYNMKDYTI